MKISTLALLLAAFVAPLPAAALELSSPDVAEAAAVPAAHVLDGFGCSGGNRSPALAWSGAPEGTKSFALTLYDPDAPTGSGFWHWVVIDLPASATGLPVGPAALPPGARVMRSDFGTTAYGGPCPPPGAGMHRYVFTLRALDVERLEILDDASPAIVGFVAKAHTLAEARITAVLHR